MTWDVLDQNSLQPDVTFRQAERAPRAGMIAAGRAVAVLSIAAATALNPLPVYQPNNATTEVKIVTANRPWSRPRHPARAEKSQFSADTDVGFSTGRLARMRPGFLAPPSEDDSVDVPFVF